MQQFDINTLSVEQVGKHTLLAVQSCGNFPGFFGIMLSSASVMWKFPAAVLASVEQLH